MRIIFFTGLGETSSCFDRLVPLLPGEHKIISLWEALGNQRRRGFNILEYAQEVIDTYQIHKEDIIIGHSTGGRLAYLIKHLNGNTIVQIASWTQDGKVVTAFKNYNLLLFLIRIGVALSKRGKQRLIDSYRRRDDTKPFYIETLNYLSDGNRNCVVNQFKLALLPVPKEISESPELRIHAHRDNIVRIPDEEFYEVPGDHFSLLTHPKEVARPILELLKDKR